MSDIITYRPGMLGSRVFDEIFSGFFQDFPRHLQQSTSGYPVADIYTDESGSTVLEFALAGFSKSDLNVDVRPDKKSITVSANMGSEDGDNTITSRRIARRNFTKTYVNYDNNLDLTGVKALFENGLLTVTVPKRAEIKPVQVEIA